MGNPLAQFGAVERRPLLKQLDEPAHSSEGGRNDHKTRRIAASTSVLSGRPMAIWSLRTARGKVGPH